MTRAMILCAGFGTRLGALSDECPKPLLPMLNVPILEWGISHLVKSGIKDIVINLHHKGELFKEIIGDGKRLGANIKYSFEKEILGTGGGLKKALPLLDPEQNNEPFLSINGKLVFELDIKNLFEMHDKNSLGTMVVQPAADAMSWGAVDVDANLHVKNILGEGKYMFCGAHVIKPSDVAKIPDGEACTVRQGYLPWIKRGDVVKAFVHKTGYFAEHSTPKRYLAGNIHLLNSEDFSSRPPIQNYELKRIGSDSRVVEPVHLGSNVVIQSGCTVGPHVVLGNDVVVENNVSIKNSVVWDGALVKKSVQDSIVTRHSLVKAS